MNITVNGRMTSLPDEIRNINQLATYLKLKPQGTAIAVNQHLVTKDKWEITFIKEGDVLTVISAAFGG